MRCSGTEWKDDRDFLEKLRTRLIRDRVPLSVSIALTHRCNLNCVHCYLQPERRGRRQSSEELDTDRLLRVLDEITDLGCLFLLFTGGEALLRNDFPVLYRRAKANGMMVSVFTNGTTVTERIADLFGELPPYWVEVSIYGASEETYEAVTGDPGAFRRSLRGVERLIKRGVRVQLKTVLLNLNVHEFEQIQAIATTYSTRFRFDGVVGVDVDGGKTPLSFRVSPREIAQKEIRTKKQRQEWKGYTDKFRWVPEPRLLYNCGAGRNMFHIAANGFMQPCIMCPEPSFDLRTGDVKTGWTSVLPEVRKIAVPVNYVCNSCDHRNLCSFCPPAFVAENGYNPPEFHCELSRQRLQALTTRTGGAE